jgi:glycosyltransferase involved in cell wall biosynthesis
MDGQKPSRIAHLIGSTGMYGAERWILAQMRYVNRCRFRISIINLVDRPEERSAIVSEAQRLDYDACDFYTGGRFNPLGVLRLATMFRQRKFTILHSHGYKSDIMGLIAGRLAGIKIVSTTHGWSKEKDKKLLLYERVDTACLKLFDCVCPLSASLYAGLRDGGVETSKMKLIANGVDIGEIDEVRVVAKVNGKRRIGYIGQFIERKNLEDLIEAFFRLQRSDCELFLIGDGPCREEILRRIEARSGQSSVYCPGYTARRLEDLKSFDVFVLPSLLEGIPRCIMEAQAAGVPIVAADIDGVRDLVKSDQTGLLVPPGNPTALAEAINRILNSPALAAKLSAAGRKLVEECFSASKMAAEYENLYLSLSEDA